MNDIVRRDPRAEWIARNRLHPLHAAMQSAQGGEVRWMGPHGVIRKNPHAVGFLGPNGIRRIDRSGGQQGSGVRRASVAQEAQLPLHVVEQPAFLVAVVPDMVGGRLSSHDKDLLGLARKLAGNDGAVLAVVFGEHKESAFDSAGVDRLLHLSGGEYDGYAPEQRILALRNLENQLAPHHSIRCTNIRQSSLLRRLPFSRMSPLAARAGVRSPLHQASQENIHSLPDRSAAGCNP